MVVREVLVTKGLAVKKMRIMGRGRTGFGYTRSSHVTIRLDRVDFDAMVAAAKTPNQAATWIKRKQLVERIKLVG